MHSNTPSPDLGPTTGDRADILRTVAHCGILEKSKVLGDLIYVMVEINKFFIYTKRVKTRQTNVDAKDTKSCPSTPLNGISTRAASSFPT